MIDCSKGKNNVETVNKKAIRLLLGNRTITAKIIDPLYDVMDLRDLTKNRQTLLPQVTAGVSTANLLSQPIP